MLSYHTVLHSRSLLPAQLNVYFSQHFILGIVKSDKCMKEIWSYKLQSYAIFNHSKLL